MGLNRFATRKLKAAIPYAIIICLVYIVLLYSGKSGRSLVPSVGQSGGGGVAGGSSRVLGETPNYETLSKLEEYRNADPKDWHDWAAEKADASRAGPGEGGQPVVVPNDPETKALELQLYRENGYNGLISDMISLNRSIKDLRHPLCKSQKYRSRLPSVSVIFPFHNEHNSTLLRSCYSVINRSPPELLKEIILVDDNSDKPALLQPFEDFLKQNHIDHIVRVVRTKKREGLIRARQIGATYATGEVFVFLDAHSEANYNWLPALIDPIAEDYKTVVCPFVDVIDCDDFQLKPQDEGARGSFDWQFNYKRLPLRKVDRENPVKPFPSPVMAGGYFAISARWFWELGGYDPRLDIWGGEQYELSFKVWQCHGRMVDAPCSRVGHIYRCKYQPFKSAGVGDFISRNYKRVAEVWMDNYAQILYDKRSGVGAADAGDMTDQKAVRQRLQCKPFSWFMKEVAFDQDKYYPAVEPPPGASGEIRNLGTKRCIDAQFRKENSRFGTRPCLSDHPNQTGEQNFKWTRWHDIRPDSRSKCFDASSSVEKAPVVLFGCHQQKGNQLWKYKFDTQQIFHPVSGHCLEASEKENDDVYMSACDGSNARQKWKWQMLDEKLLRERQDKEKEEDEL